VEDLSRKVRYAGHKRFESIGALVEDADVCPGTEPAPGPRYKYPPYPRVAVCIVEGGDVLRTHPGHKRV
jgi:hypothetical protein